MVFRIYYGMHSPLRYSFIDFIKEFKNGLFQGLRCCLCGWIKKSFMYIGKAKMVSSCFYLDKYIFLWFPERKINIVKRKKEFGNWVIWILFFIDYILYLLLISVTFLFRINQGEYVIPTFGWSGLVIIEVSVKMFCSYSTRHGIFYAFYFGSL